MVKLYNKTLIRNNYVDKKTLKRLHLKKNK